MKISWKEKTGSDSRAKDVTEELPEGDDRPETRGVVMDVRHEAEPTASGGAGADRFGWLRSRPDPRPRVHHLNDRSVAETSATRR